MILNNKISDGVVHKVPGDLKEALVSAPLSLKTWEDITPLARNEWICWIEDAKKSETRKTRIHRTKIELAQGKRRPCCWPGCPHRKNKKLNFVKDNYQNK